MKNFLMDKDNTVLVGIDFQEKLMPAMKNSDDVQDKTVKLIKGCRTFGIPMIFTQQYTKGFGMSIEKIQKAVTDKEFSWIEKSSFSAVGSPEFLDRLRAEGRNTVLMSGVEAHVCVLQTAIELVEKGFNVYYVVDCMVSRSDVDKEFALKRAIQSKIMLTTMESALFELLKGADKPGFKEISKIVK